MKKILKSLNRIVFGEEPTHYTPASQVGMRDSAVAHNGKRYVTHSSLHHSESAIKTFTFVHLFLLASLVFVAYLILYFFGYIALAISSVSAITLLYFADLLFNLFLVQRSFSKSPELAITRDEMLVRGGGY